MTRPHISQPILENVLSFFTLMSEDDQESFLYVWDSWVRVAADLRQHLYETNAASALSTIGPTQNSLNVPFVLDPEQAVYRRALAFGRIDRGELPVPGSNQLTFPDGHVEVVPVEVGDTFLFAAGATNNPADFEISDVDDGVITTLQAFAAEPEPTLDYRVDRGELPDPIFVGCAEVYAIDSTIKSVPQLSTTVGPGGYTLVEGADYVVHAGHIGFYSRTPKTHTNGFGFLFAPRVVVDEERPFRNFGFPIGFKRESSEQYVRGLQALWFALWNGPSVQNVEVGASVLFGLPFTTPGIVESVVVVPGGGWEVTVVGEERVTHVLPPGFPPTVSAGQEVGFEALTDGARVADYLEEPEFIELFNLQPRLAKFHTLFVIVAYEVLENIQAETGEVIDFEPIVGFVDRIKQVRVDFQVLVELLIPEEVRLSAEPPIVDGVVRGHALMGANFANLITIDDFGSPGLAYPHGYRDDYELESALSGTVLSFRDSGDELTVEWDEGAAQETPEKDVLPGRFVLQLANSVRISGALSVGVWAGGLTVTLSKGSFDHTQVKAGDVLILTGSVIPLNQEAFTIESIAIGPTTFTLTFDRAATAEDGLSFTVYRFYAPASNQDDVIILDPATLVLDGLDPDDPGAFSVWRWRRGGEAMRADYEAEADTGRLDFTKRATRMVFDFDSDAIKIIDRVKITVLDQAGDTVEVYDQRDEDGDLPLITTDAPTTPVPVTDGPTTLAPTPAPTTPAPTTLAPTPAPTTLAPTPAPTTLAPTTLAPTTPAPTTLAPTPAPTTPAPTTLFPETAGLLLNLDAQSLALGDGATVTNWADSGPAGNDAGAQDGGPTFETNELNGNPVVRFAGTDSLRLPVDSATDFDLTTGYTLIFVARIESGAVIGKCDDAIGTGTAGRRYLNHAEHRMRQGRDDALHSFYGHGCGPQRFAIVVARVTGDGAGGVTQRYHGMELPTDPGADSSWDITTTNGKRVTIGKSFEDLTAERLVGDIAQIMVYDHALSVPEIQALEEWLSDRWGIPLEHPFGFNPADLLSDASRLGTWYDVEESNNAVADDGTPSQIWDLSGHNDHITGGSFPPIRYAEISGRKVLDFNGTSHYMFNSGVFPRTSGAGATVVMIGRVPTGGTLQFAKNDAALGTSGRRTWQCRVDPGASPSDLLLAWGTDVGTARPASDQGSAENVPIVYGVSARDNTDVVITFDDNPLVSVTPAGAFDVVSGSNSEGQTIGRNYESTSAEYSEMDFAMVICIEEGISDEALVDLMNDFAFVYGFEWASHPASTEAPTTPVPTTPVPTPIVEDTFNDTDAPNIDLRTMSDGSSTWEQISGTIELLGNLAHASNVSGNAKYRCDSMADIADMEVVFEYREIQHGVLARIDATAANGYMCYIAGAPTQVQIFRITAGGFTLLTNPVFAMTPGDTVRFRLVGSSLEAYVNDVLRASTTDANHASGKAGLFADQLNDLDHFRVYEL